MKTFLIFLTLLIWFALTLVLVASIFGIFLLAHDNYGNPSSWMQIGLDLKNKLVS